MSIFRFVRPLMKCNRSRVSKQHNQRLNAPTKVPNMLVVNKTSRLVVAPIRNRLHCNFGAMHGIDSIHFFMIRRPPRSTRRSAPQTLHRFRLSLEPTPKVLPRTGTSKLARFFDSPPSAASAAALSWAILSASRAASSASGLSGIVSRLEILGLLDRIELGVDGTEEEG